MRSRTIAIIGYGSIGRELVVKLTHLGRKSDIIAILVRPEHLKQRSDLAETGLPFVLDTGALLECEPGIVVECAGVKAVADIGIPVLGAGCDLVAASAGALVDDQLRSDLIAVARPSGARLLLPSGAIGAADALAAMRLAGLEKVLYRGIKPPKAWLGSPAEQICDLARVTSPTVVFEGTARQAAADFPKNANVAAIIGLAGVGLDETLVQLIADPLAVENRHEIDAAGKTGAFEFRISGVPSKENPKTSALTAYSLLYSALTRTAAVVFD